MLRDPRPFCQLSVVVVALLFSIMASPGFAGTGPTTPTFVLGWGSTGSAHGLFNNVSGLATDAQGNVYVADRANSRMQKFDVLGNYLGSWGGFASGGPGFAAVDSSGNVYATDVIGNKVLEFDGNGNLITQWGSLGNGNGQFNDPSGIALDDSGNVYVTEFLGNRVQKFTSSGAFVTKWGSPGSGAGQFTQPVGVAVDHARNIYVVDSGDNRVEVFTTDGVYEGQFGSTGNGTGQFSTPVDVACDAVGNLYVSDAGNNRVQKFSSGTASYVTQWGSGGTGAGQFNYPYGLAVDAAGNVYVGEFNGNRVQKFSGAGVGLPQQSEKFILGWGSQGGTPGQFVQPWGVAINAGGYVFVADDSRIVEFDPFGNYVAEWGSSGTGNGQFNYAKWVATDASGNIYVSDRGLDRVQKFDSNGIYITQWGSPGSGNGQFNLCEGIAADAAGNVYVVDSGNSRVQKFSSTGTYLAQWGSAGSGNGQFNVNYGIAVDAAGDVYVADCFNNRVQKFSSSGVFITKWNESGPVGLAADAMGDIYVSTGSYVSEYSSSGAPLDLWGYGQFTGIDDIATDPAGDVYVVDGGAYHVQKWGGYPLISFITDSRNDQGHRVRLRFQRLTADSPNSGLSVYGYDVFLRAEVPSPGFANHAGDVQPAGATVSYMVLATGAPTYTVDVGTAVDATAASSWYSAFFVRAYTSSGTFDSDFGYGVSIDNIPPPTPSPFTAAYSAGNTHLHWGPNPASDFATFKLYRGSNASFTPGPGNLVVATPDTGYSDPGAAGNYYKLSAVDVDGNESAYATLGPGQTADAGGPQTAVFALYGPRSNPSLGDRLMVAFSLPSRDAAELELYDVSGRRIVGREVGALGAGSHMLDLSPQTRLAPGVYEVRLRQGGKSKAVRAVVVN